MKVGPGGPLRGTLKMPGDKSISHRAALLAAVARGHSRLTGFAPGGDCLSTLKCLSQLGVDLTRDGSTVEIEGKGKYGFEAPVTGLDCGNSGTTMRLLAGLLAGQGLRAVIDGDDSLRKRPMDRIVEPLRRLGADIRAVSGRPPLTIGGGSELIAVDHASLVPSAQVKSCVLFAGMYATGTTAVNENLKTRDHSERLLKWMGADISVSDARVSINGDSILNGGAINIPGDISSAAFFVAAAACMPGSELIITDVGVNETRTALLDLLAGFGVDIDVSEVGLCCNEPVGKIRIRGALLAVDRPVVIDAAMSAKMIDELPVLAVLGTRLTAGLEIRGAGELRRKESDRITAISDGLRRLGARVAETPDGLFVHPSRLTGAVVNSYGDHRIAMALAVAATFADGSTEIEGAECVDISFPGFFDTLHNIVSS